MSRTLVTLAALVLLPACFPNPMTSGADDDRWTPRVGQSWHWQLSDAIDTSVAAAVYDVDLFDVPTETMDAIHEADRAVICYFSGGSREDWRDDAATFDDDDVGEPLDGWAGERWLDIRSDGVRAVMRTRLDLAQDKGCDAVEPDNVDAFSANSGFPLSRSDQLAYNRFLAAEAHERGLLIGLKNAHGLIADLVDDFDFAVNEQCLEYDECGSLAPFLAQDKPVFHAEYVETLAEGEARLPAICADRRRADLSTIIKTKDLDAWGLACP